MLFIRIRKVKLPAKKKNAKKFQMKNIYYSNIPTVLFRFYRVIKNFDSKKMKEIPIQPFKKKFESEN